MKVYHFTSDKYALDVIANQRMKVSRFDDLNDPFELYAVDLQDRQYTNEFIAFKQHMSERIGILCFSKSWRSPLLWSHYANRHKGVALECEAQDNIIHPIKYRKRRYTINIEKVRTGAERFNKEDIDAMWLTKYVQWKYEEEMRVLLSKSDFYQENGIHFYNLGSDIQLRGIVLGPLCNISIKEIESRLPLNKKILVLKSRLAFHSFNVVKNVSFKTVHLVGKA